MLKRVLLKRLLLVGLLVVSVVLIWRAEAYADCIDLAGGDDFATTG